MGRYRKILLATGVGILVSAIGVVLMGYLSAITIPEEYFFWFRENLSLRLGLALLYMIQHILGYGLLLLAAGYLLTRKFSLAPVAAVLCLLTGFWLYFIVGVALLYEGSMRNPFPELNLPVLAMLGVNILFPVLGVALGSRYKHRMHATSV